MANPTKPSYSHGSTGTQPPSPRDYENGDALDADEFDYYVYESFSTIKDIIDALDAIDVSGKADDPHGNAAHTEQFAIEGDSQPPDNHGNEAHSSTFAVDGDTQPPETHGNEAHTKNYITSGDVDSGVSDINNQTGSVDFYHNDLFGVGSDDHHTRYTDSEARSAVNTFSGSHNDLSDVGNSDHHPRYTDSEVEDVIEDGDQISLKLRAGGVNTYYWNWAPQQSGVSDDDQVLHLDFGLDSGADTVMRIDSVNGNVDITGSLTENASL